MLIKAGYDDIKFIGETADEELEDIGIVDSADRQQVIYYTDFSNVLTLIFSPSS